MIGRQAAEAGALEAARGRIDAATPNVAVAVTAGDGPWIAARAYELPVPMSPNPTPRRQTLDYATHWQHDIFYILRGTVYNSGPHAVRVTPSDVRFHSGAHPLTGQEVAMPQ